MKNIIDEIITKYHDTPTTSLTETLAEFVANLLSIYTMFWYQTVNELNESHNRLHNIVLDYLDNFITDEDDLPCFFVYEIVDGNAHIVDAKGHREVFIKFMNEAESFYNEYAEACKEILGVNLYISNSESQIVIRSGTEFEKIL